MKQGILMSIGASALFAFMYYYATIMKPFDGDMVFAWRILFGLPMMALVVQRAKGWQAIKDTAKDCRNFKFLALMMLCSAMLGIQLWLFVWAPLHDYALDVSMGYFLLPLAMVLTGKLFYKEKLSRWQSWAVAFAVLGVAHEWFRLGTFAWPTALVALGYPPYFLLRNKLKVDALTSLWFDMLFLLPVAVVILQSQASSAISNFINYPWLVILVPLLGLLSAVSLSMYLAASRRLPMALFGLLSYVEPVLLFWVALIVLGEAMASAQWLTYGPIWFAILLITIEGVLKIKAGKSQPDV